METSIYDFINDIVEEENNVAQEEDLQNKEMFIKSYDEAERAIWYYKKLQLEIADAKLAADAYVKEAQVMADRYLKEICAPLENRAFFVEQRLRNFAATERERTGRKNIKLVNGTLSFSKQQDKYERNEAEILDFCISAGQNSNLAKFLKPQQPKLDWALLKKEGTVKSDENGNKRLFFDGALIPSVTVVPQEDSFKVQ